jgi:anti-sigma factor RsiW
MPEGPARGRPRRTHRFDGPTIRKMTADQQLKLQAFLDGELAEIESREVAAWVARDVEAAQLLTELRHTRKALMGFEAGIKLPEAREFFWSKIEREIQSLDPEPARARPGSFFSRLQRLLVPVGAVAALALVVMVAGLRFGLFPAAAAPESETTVSDPGTFTYQDFKSGTTLVWLSYPAQR